MDGLQGLRPLLTRAQDLLSDNCIARHEHNRQFVLEAKARYARFFETVEKRPVTEEQIEAALAFDDLNLTVAAAGSGKTSVIVAKVGFALASGMFRDGDVLVLAFNRDAAKELSNRIRDRLSKALQRNVKVTVRTFHSLGNRLLRESIDEDVRPEKLDGSEGKRRFLAAFDRLCREDAGFRQNLLDWIVSARYGEPKLDPGGADVDANEQRYHEACRKVIRSKLREGRRWYDAHVATLDPKLRVRSFEEASIANWLILRHVSFEYERPVFNPIASMMKVPKSKNGKQLPYKPDFLYPAPEGTGYIFHEHFGVDQTGRAPDFLGSAYEQRVRQKRQIFRTLTAAGCNIRSDCVWFFETLSGDFASGTVFTRLEQQLRTAGIEVGPEDEELKEKALAEFRKSGDVEHLFLRFVQTFRDSGLTEREVRTRAEQSGDVRRAHIFLDLAFRLCTEVEHEYARSGIIEFSDMIRGGTAALLKNEKGSAYRLILVDEFQDIARSRMDLVEALVQSTCGTAVLFCVGDDWQAINRFAGSDIGIFNAIHSGRSNTSASNAKPGVTVQYLSNTFRCCQGLADVARAVVLQNRGQIDKPVQSQTSRQTAGTVRVVGHESDRLARTRTLESELRRIASLHTGERAKVFVLTRYKDVAFVPEGLEEETVAHLARSFAAKLQVDYKTMHSSKGLECDYVIIGGLDAGFRGFPSNLETDPLFELLLPPQSNAIDEERRLLYVAITRARIQATLLTASEAPSEFVLELSRLPGLTDHLEWINIDPNTWRECPVCKRGILRTDNFNLTFCTRYPRCAFRMSVLHQS
jgi:DNA helicase-4